MSQLAIVHVTIGQRPEENEGGKKRKERKEEKEWTKKEKEKRRLEEENELRTYHQHV